MYICDICFAHIIIIFVSIIYLNGMHQYSSIEFMYSSSITWKYLMEWRKSSRIAPRCTLKKIHNKLLNTEQFGCKFWKGLPKWRIIQKRTNSILWLRDVIKSKGQKRSKWMREWDHVDWQMLTNINNNLNKTFEKCSQKPWFQINEIPQVRRMNKINRDLW